jgi:hypothetical protein
VATEYVRADDVLPPKLLMQVRKYYTGVVYIPASREFYERRRRKVLSLHAKGFPTSVIAGRVCVCRRRVQQIIREQHCSPAGTDEEE